MSQEREAEWVYDENKRIADSDLIGWLLQLEEPEPGEMLQNSPPSKNADHAIRCNGVHVLIECKGLRPNTQLLMTGDPKDVDTLVGRVAKAVVQLTKHAESINSGAWTMHGLSPQRCFGLVVTYGDIPTADGFLFRGRVRERLQEQGCAQLPHLVLSLSDFDSFLRLVELGHLPDAIMHALTENENVAFPGEFQSDLATDAISHATRQRGEAFFATLPDEPDGV